MANSRRLPWEEGPFGWSHWFGLHTSDLIHGRQWQGVAALTTVTEGEHEWALIHDPIKDIFIGKESLPIGMISHDPFAVHEARGMLVQVMTIA